MMDCAEKIKNDIKNMSMYVSTLVPCGGDGPIDFICLVKGWLGRVCQLLGSKPNLIREGELAAFLSYAIAYPQNFLTVIDSYSVSCSGLLCFCAVALGLDELQYRPLGLRLDSGDLCRQSLEVRRVTQQTFSPERDTVQHGLGCALVQEEK
ncbi:nicotinate phosphoribosyltransferase-like [Rhinichthys klamathensis goyatoka]|uniref:nicotinate phosphoribosyltransferase-like n=1 Tax=Rhinichthys klamathensis goyatoka TaxID=3034132 RepID=UPI0024B5C23B|nr:nicotinate phosphoribosyltransferase-like [Rhinichthys klamathensis goyatoka]